MLSRWMVVSGHLGVSVLLYICRAVYAVLFCYVYQLTGWLLDMIPRILLRGFGLFRTGDNFGFSGLKYTFNSLSVRMTLILLRFPSFECECIGWIRLGYHYSMNTKPKSIIHWRACCSHFFLSFFSWDVTWGISGTAQIYMLGDGTEGVCRMYLVS